MNRTTVPASTRTVAWGAITRYPRTSTVPLQTTSSVMVGFSLLNVPWLPTGRCPYVLVRRLFTRLRNKRRQAHLLNARES